MPPMKDDLPLREMDDLRLAQLSREGRREAFGELVSRYQDRVYALALRLTGNADDAAEIAQEAFLKAWRALGAFRGESAFYTWLFRITVNEARTRQRARAARPAPLSLDAARREDGPTPVEAAAARTPDPSDEAARAESRRLVEEGLGRLELEHREIIVLRDIEGRDYEEIADVLGCPRGTVKSRLHRARAALRGLLAPALGFARLEET